MEEEIRLLHEEIGELKQHLAIQQRHANAWQDALGKNRRALAQALKVINKFAGPEGSASELGSMQELMQVTRTQIKMILMGDV